jgi:GDP-L-fucose synthase
VTRRVFVAGHGGLVGSAVSRRLSAQGDIEVLHADRQALDLRDASAVSAWFDENRPDAVVLAAARVGGIGANAAYPVTFLLDNLRIQNAVIAAAHDCDIQHLIFLGSSCIYPRDAPQPLKETALLTGPLEPTNRPYAIAKIAGIELCWALNRQFGRRYICLMPTNLYGPGDSFDLADAHVLPALIRRMHEAREAGQTPVTLWGTGTPRREFLFSEDLADAIAFLLNHDGARGGLCIDEHPPLVNVGIGKDLTIEALARRIADTVGFSGVINWDAGRSDGTARKLLDVGRLSELGWRATTSLEDGLRRTYGAFVNGHGRHVS